MNLGCDCFPYSTRHLVYHHSVSICTRECSNVKSIVVATQLHGRGVGGTGWAGSLSILSEFAGCQMEYRYLAHLTGRPEYVQTVEFTIVIQLINTYLCCRLSRLIILQSFYVTTPNMAGCSHFNSLPLVAHPPRTVSQ